MHELRVSYVYLCVHLHTCVHTDMHTCAHGATEPRLFPLPVESMTQPASLSERVLPAYQVKTGAARGISY